MELPDGFTAFNSGERPVDAEQFVELLILTNEGVGTSGVCRARLHDWTAEGIGSIVGYRLAKDGERPALDAFTRIPVAS